MGTLSIPSQGIRVPAKPRAKGLLASGMLSRPRFPKYDSAVYGLWLGPISPVVGNLKGRAHADP